MLRYIVKDIWDGVHSTVAWKIWDNDTRRFTWASYTNYEAAKRAADKKNGI